MTLFYSELRYLAIRLCVGIGILLADQLYLRYGNPHQCELGMEEMLEELYESQADLSISALFRCRIPRNIGVFCLSRPNQLWSRVNSPKR